MHPNFKSKTIQTNILPQKFSGQGLPKLVVLLAIISKRRKKERNEKSQCVQKKHFDSMSLWFTERKIIFTQPLIYCVCIKGNKCIMFPAFILKLATVFLILEFHMVPETQNYFLLVISSAKWLSTFPSVSHLQIALGIRGSFSLSLSPSPTVIQRKIPNPQLPHFVLNWYKIEKEITFQSLKTI